MLFQNLVTLVFMSSESCNLNCQYCEIAANSHSAHMQEAKNVREALISGKYVTKYKQFFNKYNIKPEQITRLELWGQEPTLTLDAFNTQIVKVLDWLVKCKHFFFSTNGVSYPERIIECIDIINQYLTKNKNRKMGIQIQFSFDGKKQTKEKRGADPERIINNIKKVITEVNKLDITPNFTIQFDFHGVITLDLIRDSLASGDVRLYWLEIDEMLKEFHQLNTKRQIGINSLYSNFQQPYYCTVEDGKMAAEYCKQCLEANGDFTTSFLGIISPMAHVANSLFAPQEESATTDRPRRNYPEDIRSSFNYEYDKIIPEWNYVIGDFYGCGVGRWNIKMRYDGTVIYCQNSFYSVKKENLENKTGVMYDVMRYELDHPGFQPNVLTSKKEDIENFVNIFDVKKHFGHNFEISTIINLMQLLAEYDQIDPSYKNNPEKILRHASMLGNFIECFYNNVMDTGSLYNFTIGTIKFYCNGVFDIVEQYINEWEYFGPWK